MVVVGRLPGFDSELTPKNPTANPPAGSFTVTPSGENLYPMLNGLTPPDRPVGPATPLIPVRNAGVSVPSGLT